MKTDIISSHAAPVWICALAIAFAMLACEIGGLTIQLTDEPSSSTSRGAPAAADSPECLPGILPGKTSRDEVLARLGPPINTYRDVIREVLSYASSMRGQLNFVAVQNGVVTLETVIQPEEQPLAWSDVKKKRGEPAHTSYTNYSQGSRVFAFPTAGYAYVADEQWDAVYIRQCFVPMTTEQYMLAYGNFLPTEDPFTE